MDSEVASAEAGVQPDSMKNKEWVVQLTLTDEGAKAFADATSANVGKQISIVYDGEVISSPRVTRVPSQTAAQSSPVWQVQSEAEKLASSIRIGSLSLELEELRSKVVGAQLGEEAISHQPDRRSHRS